MLTESISDVSESVKNVKVISKNIFFLSLYSIITHPSSLQQIYIKSASVFFIEFSKNTAKVIGAILKKCFVLTNFDLKMGGFFTLEYKCSLVCI